MDLFASRTQEGEVSVQKKTRSDEEKERLYVKT